VADLAVALVNLGISAERRRTERRNLREAVPMVVAEMLRHLRVGDHVTIRGDANECEGDRTYRVEQVTWNLQYIDPDHGYPSMPEPHPKGAPTLVLYPRTIHTRGRSSWTSGVSLASTCSTPQTTTGLNAAGEGEKTTRATKQGCT
jgi:hypothetical protein